jgi:trk system potassium uptake protein TrkH
LLLPVTFLIAILAGAVVLELPAMSGPEVGPLEALFTATSAVCVTGLIVVDTGTAFTHAGQGVIMLLIQLGGLGIMTFSVLALVMVGRRVTLHHEAHVKSTFTTVAGWPLPRLLVTVFGVTLLFELAGFFVLRPALGDTWSAAFHSVSAFCNAGFSLYADSLHRFGPSVVLPILALLVFGGLGFTTLIEIGRNLVPRKARRRRFSLHARVVFLTSLILWGAGTLLIAITEVGDFRHAFFMSASARTAGFDTVSVANMSGGSILVLIFLMFVGASPGSTGGGIKTTTLALVVLVVVSTLRGREHISMYGREMPRMILRRMFAVVACSVLVVFVAVFLLDVFEGGRHENILALIFEAVSAFGTVGLSMGVTAGLTTASKLLLCLVMFIGRVGSLSLFVLLVRDAAPSRVRYPEERIMVG